MEKLIEQWIDLPNYEDHYQISNFGNFAKKTKTGRLLRKLNSATHYLSVSLKNIDGTGQKCIYIHTTVAKLFIGERPDGMVIRHLDGNRYNNKVSNLQYGYPKQNYEDLIKHKTNKGSNNGRAILNENSAKAIKFLLQNNVSVKLLSNAFDVSIGTIYAIDKGRNWSDS
jgi:hypothetical protein